MVAGTAVYSKIEPDSVTYGIPDSEFHDNMEGRCISLFFPEFVLVSVYTPHSGAKLERLPLRLRWDNSLWTYLRSLKDKKVILCGDLNVANEEIDLARPKQNQK